jgi:hypothetical protein
MVLKELEKVPSPHCGLMTPKGDERPNAISKREPNNETNRESDFEARRHNGATPAMRLGFQPTWSAVEPQHFIAHKTEFRFSCRPPNTHVVRSFAAKSFQRIWPPLTIGAMFMLVAPLGLPAAPDGRERRLQDLPGAAALLEQGAKLRTAHTLAPFRPEAALVEDGQDHQFGRRSL